MNIRDRIAEMDPRMLIADGFDRAIIGIGSRCGQPDIVVYDTKKAIEILMECNELTYEEACEFFDFNVVGSWVGEKTPIWVNDMREKDAF